MYLCVYLADPGEHVRCRRASCLDIAALHHTFGDETFGDEDSMPYITYIYSIGLFFCNGRMVVVHTAVLEGSYVALFCVVIGTPNKDIAIVAVIYNPAYKYP